MKYIISNKKFKDSIEIDNFFVTKSLNSLKKTPIFIEGFKEDDNGCFNEITCNFKQNKLKVKNDKAGVLTIYYYLKSGIFILSNSFWDIVKILDDIDENLVKIDEKELKFLMFQYGGNPYGKTYIENLNELQTGSILNIDLNSFEYNIEQYWSLQSTGEIKDIDVAVNQADNSLNKTFERIHKLDKNEVHGFGNSGGLDSRLIPAYAQKHGIKVQGYTVVEKRKYFKSVTEQNANKVSKLYNFKSYFNYFNTKNLTNRLDTDISVNPLGPNQILKNHYNHSEGEKITKYISGGNGYTIGGNWARFNGVDKKDIKTELERYLNKIQTYQLNNVNKDIQTFLNSEDLAYFKKIRNEFFTKNAHKGNIDIFRTIHLEMINKHSFHGGYESQNSSLPTFNMYYPFMLENSLKWDTDMLLHRTLLKKLILKNSKELYQIPDQELNYLYHEHNIVSNFFREVRLKVIYSQGLNYKQWLRDNELNTFFKTVMKRQNKLWDSIFPKCNMTENLYKSSSFTVDIIKGKRIADIIYYKEYKNLNFNKYKINE